MIKRAFVLLLMLLPMMAIMGQKRFKSIEEILRHFHKVEGVDYQVTDTVKIVPPFAEKITFTETLTFEDCDEKYLKEFCSLDMTVLEGYELMFKIVDGEDVVTLLMKPVREGSGDPDYKEAIYVVQGPEEGVLLRLHGVFGKPDLSLLKHEQ